MRPTLILLHGFPQDHHVWDPNMDALGKVAQTIAPDLRGFGPATDIPGVLSMEAFAEDLKALIDERDLEKVVLCGLSMGGYVALAFLERWPEHVEGLILCNTRSTADTPEGKIAREATAVDALEKGSAVIARAMLPKVLSVHTRTERPEIARSVEHLMARQRPETIAAAARGMAQRPDRTQVLREVRVPVLIITGEHDELMPLATSEAMAKAAPGAQLVVLPQAAHLSNLEATTEFDRIVTTFVQHLPDA